MDIRNIAEADLATLKTAGYNETDLSMLAESEIKALLTPDSTDAEDPHEAAARAQQEADAAAAATARAAKDAAKAATQTETPPANAPAAPAMTVLKAEVPADAQQKIDEMRAKDTAAFKKLMDGEIDAEEYNKTRRDVEGEIDKLKEASLKASIFNEVNQQNAEQAARAEWDRAESAAFSSFKAEGLDYKSKPALLAAYNHNLKQLGQDPKNESRDASWFLTEAHRLTKTDLGIAITPPNTKPAGGSTDPNTNEVIPPTLRAVPASATGAVETDEFAHLRNLTGLEAERAHARLTPEQRDRWMNE